MLGATNGFWSVLIKYCGLMLCTNENPSEIRLLFPCFHKEYCIQQKQGKNRVDIIVHNFYKWSWDSNSNVHVQICPRLK